jgi:hypothetical protein
MRASATRILGECGYHRHGIKQQSRQEKSPDGLVYFMSGIHFGIAITS